MNSTKKVLVVDKKSCGSSPQARSRVPQYTSCACEPFALFFCSRSRRPLPLLSLCPPLCPCKARKHVLAISRIAAMIRALGSGTSLGSVCLRHVHRHREEVQGPSCGCSTNTAFSKCVSASPCRKRSLHLGFPYLRAALIVWSGPLQT